MTFNISSPHPIGGLSQTKPLNSEQAGAAESPDITKRFEQMLWAEMLSHVGLEKAFTQSGGEGASAFSRYIVEAIAEDISEKHPLGLTKELGHPNVQSSTGE